MTKSFFDSVKTWLDIYEKVWKSKKNNDFNQPVDKESRPLNTIIINWSLLKGEGEKSWANGGGDPPPCKPGLWSTFFSYSLPILSRPSILLTIFTKAARLPSSKTLPYSLLALTHKLSHIYYNLFQFVKCWIL